jgi:parallel beta-helix repeat protein
MRLLEMAVVAGGLFAVGQAEAGPTVVMTRSDSGPNSLRGVIDYVNSANCGAVMAPTITFELPAIEAEADGTFLLETLAPLPWIVCPDVKIDGYSQSGSSPNTLTSGGSNAAIKVRLEASANGGPDGIVSTSSGTVIRGLSFSGWPNAAVNFDSCTACAVEGSFINVTPSGSPLAGAGLRMGTDGSVVGGASAAQRNLIASMNAVGVNVGAAVLVQRNGFNVSPGGSAFSGATGIAVNVTGSGATVVENEFHTSTAASIWSTGASDLGDLSYNRFKNTRQAIWLGGNDHQVEQNQVEGTTSDAIYVAGYNSVIFGNVIRGAQRSGIAFGGSSGYADMINNVIENSAEWGIEDASGGMIQGNVISGNGEGGISVTFNNSWIRGNQVFGNGGPGIDLGEDGPTANDESAAPYDGDFGPNELQNHPVITRVVHAGGNTEVTWYLKTEPVSFFTPPAGAGLAVAKSHLMSDATIEFFSNPSMPPHNEGRTPIQEINIEQEMQVSSGHYAATTVIPGTHNFISATATTDVCNEGCYATSEFSPAVAVETVGAPALVATPSELSFGTVLVGEAAAQRVRIHNGGSAPLALRSIAASGTGFSVVSDCAATLAVGAGCTLEVTFAPAAPGPHSAQVAIANNGLPDPYMIRASGEAVATLPAALSTEASLDFGQAVAGTIGRRTLVLRNTGGEPLVISELRTAAPFGVEGACPSIAARDSCTITVTFLPTAVRVFGGRLEIFSSNPAGVVRVELFGEGTPVPGPELALSAASLAFGSQGLGTASAVQRVTLRSIGGMPVELRGFESPAEFLVDAAACPAVLPVEASCEVSVTFRPMLAGPREGRLVIHANVAGASREVGLAGTGCRFFTIASRRNPSRLCSP